MHRVHHYEGDCELGDGEEPPDVRHSRNIFDNSQVRRPHQALATTLAALVFFALLALRSGASDGFRFLHPIQLGQRFSNPALLLPGQVPQKGVGYDGQFVFYIAQDPFLRNPAIAPSLDNSLRFRRILLPLVAWVLSLGKPSFLPLVLVITNALAATGVVGLAALAASRAGRSPLPALSLALFPGLWIPALLDLTEPLHLLLLEAGVMTGSAALLLLSGLAKETAAVAMATEFGRAAVARDWPRMGRHAVAAAVLVAWSLFVFVSVRAHESTLGGHLLDPPGAPLLAMARSLPREPARFVLVLAAILLCVLAIARLAWARDAATWAAAAYAVVALAAGIDTWADPSAYFRVLAGAVVLSFLSWVSVRDPAGSALLVLSALVGAVSLVPLLLA